MLDESRHFNGKKKVKQILDYMAFHKMNIFHWHLTDAQGWRIEIKNTRNSLLLEQKATKLMQMPRRNFIAKRILKK